MKVSFTNALRSLMVKAGSNLCRVRNQRAGASKLNCRAPRNPAQLNPKAGRGRSEEMRNVVGSSAAQQSGKGTKNLGLNVACTWNKPSNPHNCDCPRKHLVTCQWRMFSHWSHAFACSATPPRTQQAHQPCFRVFRTNVSIVDDGTSTPLRLARPFAAAFGTFGGGVSNFLPFVFALASAFSTCLPRFVLSSFTGSSTSSASSISESWWRRDCMLRVHRGTS